MNLCIIYGGVSSEHDISKISFEGVMKNIDREKYTIYPLYITKDGKWLLEGKIPAIVSPDRSHHGIVLLDGSGQQIKIDCVFPVLHGKNGEDGTIQGLFEIAGIPYVGPNYMSSAVCMDKAVTKVLVQNAGISQAEFLLLRSDDIENNIEQAVLAVEKKFPYPVFIKPSRQGSSVGIHKAKDRIALRAALIDACKFDSKILVEEFIDGYEIEVAVLGNQNPIASYCGQIIPGEEFYSFDAKYEDRGSKTLLRAEIPEETAEKIREMAIRVYQACDAEGMSRVDFFVHKQTGTIYFNEINTIPGFTPISMYPMLMQEIGISYPELIDRLIAFAVERGQREND